MVMVAKEYVCLSAQDDTLRSEITMQGMFCRSAAASTVLLSVTRPPSPTTTSGEPLQVVVAYCRSSCGSRYFDESLQTCWRLPAAAVRCLTAEQWPRVDVEID